MSRHLQGFSSAFLALAITGSASLSNAQEKGEEKTLENPKPTEITLTRTDERSAAISGHYPFHKPGTNLEIVLGGETVILNDYGKEGDAKAGDGWFSIKTGFDFDAFVKANRAFAEIRAGKSRNLYAPGGRHQIGTRQVFIEGKEAIVVDTNGKSQKRFSLPFDPGLIRPNVPLPLPMGDFPLGLPPEVDILAAASIPDSLMITKLEVVNDPDRTWSCSSTNQQPSGNPFGEWTFWSLMRNINNGTASTSDYIKELFRYWTADQPINGQMVTERSHVYDEVIRQWELRSGGPGATLLPEQSPFRLLGIVNRVDLRGGDTVYGGGDAGEGRFVFSLHDGECNSLAKTIILEYKVPVSGCANVREWAQKWKALESSPNYNNDLTNLTEVFTAAGANPSGPNGSAISQVRTNELFPMSPEWELREFVLDDGGGFLSETTVKQEPQEIHNNAPLLADYVNLHWPDLIGGTHVIPEIFNGAEFLAGRAPAPLLWNVPDPLLSIPAPSSNKDDALHGLAVNTCSGCHTLETGTNFAHLHYNTQPGQEAILSGFMTGISLPDTREPSIIRSFNDLNRRADDLDLLAASNCRIDGFTGNDVLNELMEARILRAVH